MRKSVRHENVCQGCGTKCYTAILFFKKKVRSGESVTDYVKSFDSCEMLDE